MVAIDQSKIQGLIFTGYPERAHARYVIYEISDPAGARGWLGQLSEIVTNGTRDPTNRTEEAVNVAISYAGLEVLGLPAAALGTFPREFVEGMAGSAVRSRILGDTDRSAPETWDWGRRVAKLAASGEQMAAKDTEHAGVRERSNVHLVLMLFAKTAESVETLYRQQQARSRGALREVSSIMAAHLPNKREHFGFRDGISIPRIEGSAAREGVGLVFIKPGEFILGYPNEYGQLPPSPTVADHRLATGLPPVDGQKGLWDLGANGSYVVVRQLAQDVPGFWEAMLSLSGAEDGTPTQAKAEELAAKCVGRWPTGVPLALSSNPNDLSRAAANDFAYGKDPIGNKCPIGAHVRRANPRDSLEPNPTESARLTRRHQIIRRGRSYGPAIERHQKEAAPQDRGLLFIAVNCNIRRQFEFIQQTWLNNPKFGGLYDETDPINGERDAPLQGGISIPSTIVRRRLRGLAPFVTTRGGEYFFLPSLPALRYLADMPRESRSPVGANTGRPFARGLEGHVGPYGDGSGVVVKATSDEMFGPRGLGFGRTPWTELVSWLARSGISMQTGSKPGETIVANCVAGWGQGAFSSHVFQPNGRVDLQRLEALIAHLGHLAQSAERDPAKITSAVAAAFVNSQPAQPYETRAGLQQVRTLRERLGSRFRGHIQWQSLVELCGQVSADGTKIVTGALLRRFFAGERSFFLALIDRRRALLSGTLQPGAAEGLLAEVEPLVDRQKTDLEYMRNKSSLLVVLRIIYYMATRRGAELKSLDSTWTSGNGPA
jgi:Dyp-type peroxidase family